MAALGGRSSPSSTSMATGHACWRQCASRWGAGMECWPSCSRRRRLPRPRRSSSSSSGRRAGIPSRSSSPRRMGRT
eukprot:15432848-Alexandrium_andersonii.AAC.1